jgi:hypothetical protein
MTCFFFKNTDSAWFNTTEIVVVHKATVKYFTAKNN